MLSPTLSTNSDESQRLVIDEPSMEIDSDHVDEYFDSMINGGPKQVPEPVPNVESYAAAITASGDRLQLPTRENTPQRNEIPVAVVAPSSANKEKSSTPKPKRVAHTHSFKLSNLMNPNTELCVSDCGNVRFNIVVIVISSFFFQISALPSQFYNMRIYMMPDSLLVAEFSQRNESPPELSIINLEQLLNWPDVRVTVNFRDLMISRMVRSNYEHDLVFGDDPAINLDTKPNTMDTRLRSMIVTNKSNPMVYTPILLTYFEAVINAAILADMSKARRNEIEQIYKKIVEDFEKLKVVETKKEHSRFLAPYKYVRLFNNDNKYDKVKSHGLKVQLRETINPEVVFSVDRCKFDIDQTENWEKDVLMYLDHLFTKQDKLLLESLVDILKKCIIVSCTICNKSFEGILCIVSIKGHLWEHYNKTNWTCVACKKSFSPLDLTGQANWSHKCELPNGTPP